MNLLSWLLVLELLLLLSAYIAWIAGRMAARDRHDDALYHFTVVFWRTFRQKPLPLRASVLATEDEGEGESAEARSFEDELEEFDSLPAAGPARPGQDNPLPTAPLIRQAILNVRVLANSQRDQIVGWDGRSLKIQVIADAEAGAANKAVIDLLTSTLGIKTHQLLLVRGHYQSQKTLQISGLAQSELEKKLEGFE